MATTSGGGGADELPAALAGVMSLLEPGTRPSVFAFFKGVVIALVCIVAFMLFGMEMPSDVQFHLKIFLGLSICLMVITIWWAASWRHARRREATPTGVCESCPPRRKGALPRSLHPVLCALVCLDPQGFLASCKARWRLRRQQRRRKRKNEASFR